MDQIKGWLTGGVLTLVIGGASYSFSQQDVANNMVNDTNLSQEQAEQYVSNVTEEDLVSFDELGSSFVTQGQEALEMAKDIDCTNYEYEWESSILSCAEGKNQLSEYARDNIAVGHAYQAMSLDSSSETDINHAIEMIGELNSDLKLPIIKWIFTSADIEEINNTNSYNKALLETALESDSQR